MITIDDFSKVEIKVGVVLEAEEVEGSEKLIKLTVDFGEESPRTVLTGIKAWKTPQDFQGKQLTFVTNLEPRKMMGMESQAMVMAVDGSAGTPVFLVPEVQVSPGSKAR